MDRITEYTRVYPNVGKAAFNTKRRPI